MDTRWENLKQLIDSPLETRVCRLVKWIKPHPPFVKVNSDGSGIDGVCGAGGVIRIATGSSSWPIHSF